MEKIKVKDINGNGKLDIFDVVAYYGATGINILITALHILSVCK